MGRPGALCDFQLCSQERINCLEGTHEFFEAIGFQKALLAVPDQGKLSTEGPWLSWELQVVCVLGGKGRLALGSCCCGSDIPACSRGPRRILCAQ